jgi:mRNA interferase MazF
VKRGEIRWYTFRLPDKRRPVLILTRNDVIDQLNEVIVVPATRTIRGLTTEVVLTADDRMPATCALNFDHVSLAQRSRLGPVLCELSETRWAEVRDALLIACGFGRSAMSPPAARNSIIVWARDKKLDAVIWDGTEEQLLECGKAAIYFGRCRHRVRENIERGRKGEGSRVCVARPRFRADARTICTAARTMVRKSQAASGRAAATGPHDKRCGF